MRRRGSPRATCCRRCARTHRVITDPLGLLLDAYERHGPVFSLRVLSTRIVFMLGPAANHRILVSHASDFTWRDGGFADLIPLLGDGLLTIDGEFHRRSRRIMLPAFHRERIAAALDTMQSEIERAIAPWRPGDRVDLYAWGRELALRVAMRALFGLDPDRRPAGMHPAREFERALGYYGREYWLQVLRGPRTPWAALTDARGRLDGLIFSEIARRRRSGERGEDLLSLLLDATDEDGGRLSDQHVRDEVMTLLFAGHDTTTATVAFLFRELALRPDVAGAIAAELAALGRPPGHAELMGGGLPQLDMALDETLRLYPPAWIGPRRAVRTFEFEGVTVPPGRAGELLLVRLAPARRRLGGPARLPPRALHARAARSAAEGRVRPLRRRLAPVHRHALRPARDQGDRGARSCASTGSSSCRATGSRCARRPPSGRRAGCRWSCVKWRNLRPASPSMGERRGQRWRTPYVSP